MRQLLTSLSLLVACLPVAGSAADRALLVGVSDYLYLDADLRGPANDVGLVAETLVARGVAAAQITVLAAEGVVLPEGVRHAGLPERQAILAGLAGLGQGAGAGDQLFFYYSGHGSQAPDQNGDEAGGYDEILLPADAKGWRGAIGQVENAIIDDELAPLMQGLLDTGAEVVAVIDACHSATGFRGGGQGVARYIAPDALGLPLTSEGSDSAAHGGAVAGPLVGQYAFLYSAQADQRAFEYPLGPADDPASWYGDFTRSLMGVLAEAPRLTWAQALQATQDRMRGDSPAAQTPDGEGPLMAAAVLGVAAPVARVQILGGTLQAGLLSGWNIGAEVAVYLSLEATTPVALGRVAEITANTSTIEGADVPSEGYAELLRPGLPPAVGFATPVVADAGDYEVWQAAWEEIAAAALPGLQFAAPAPDWVPYFQDGGLVLAGADGVLDAARAPRITEVSELLALIEASARTVRMRRALALAERQSATGFALPGVGGLKVTLGRAAGAVDAQDAQGGCDLQGPDLVAVTAPVAAQHCDQLWLSLSNGSKTARDVTVLYLDRDLGLTAIWPEPGLSNRVLFGEVQEVGMLVQNPSDQLGREEIIVLSMPAQEGSPRVVLTGLADPAQTRAMGQDSAMGNWLSAAIEPEAGARSFAFGGPKLPELKVHRFRVELMAE